MLVITLIILKLNFPVLHYNHIDVSPNFFLIALIVFSLKNNSDKIILVGFGMGIVNDILLSSNYFGFVTFLYTIFSYILLRSDNYKSRNIYNIYTMLSFFVCVYLMYVFSYSDTYFFYFKYSLIKSLFSFLIIYFIDKAFEVSKKRC
mgnify:CR=1 FL=1